MVRRGKRTRTFGHVKQQARHEEAEPRHHAGARYSWRHFCPGVKTRQLMRACPAFWTEPARSRGERPRTAEFQTSRLEQTMPQGSSNTGIEALCEQRADLLGVRPPRNHRLNFYEKPGKRSGVVPVRIEAGPHAPESDGAGRERRGEEEGGREEERGRKRRRLWKGRLGAFSQARREEHISAGKDIAMRSCSSLDRQNSASGDPSASSGGRPDEERSARTPPGLCTPGESPP